MSDAPRPVGRPTDYRPEYCDSVIEYGRAGKSRAWIAATLGVAKRTLVLWEAANPDFLSAMEYAKTLEQLWWEEQGQANLVTGKDITFQSAMWSRSMAARFPDDWRETSRQERTGPDGGPQQLNVTGDAVADLTRRLARLAAAQPERGPIEGAE